MTRYDSATVETIRKARGNFVAMVVTYFFSAFNDNFYKQAMSLVAIAAAHKEYQGYATVLFTLPYLLLAAPSGWLADRFPKRRVIIGVKALELAAMVAGGFAVATLNWPVAFLVVTAMGTAAAVFSPAINGSIPELYPEAYVTKANGIVKMLTIAAILAGISFAGLALDSEGAAALPFVGQVASGQARVAVAVLVVAILGLLTSIGVPSKPAADPAARFPWAGPVNTFKMLREITKDRELNLAIWFNAYYWFIGVIEVLVINVMGEKQFALSHAWTSYLVASQLSGVAIGGLFAARASAKGWHRPVAPASLAMGAFMIALSTVPLAPPAAQMPLLMLLLCAIGAMGGLILIPVESFIQVRPPADRKGAVIAAANFAAFFGMLLSGPVANMLNKHVTPTTSFAFMGAATAVTGAAFWFVRRGETGK